MLRPRGPGAVGFLPQDRACWGRGQVEPPRYVALGSGLRLGSSCPFSATGQPGSSTPRPFGRWLLLSERTTQRGTDRAQPCSSTEAGECPSNHWGEGGCQTKLCSSVLVCAWMRRCWLWGQCQGTGGHACVSGTHICPVRGVSEHVWDECATPKTWVWSLPLPRLGVWEASSTAVWGMGRAGAAGIAFPWPFWEWERQIG